MNNKIIEGFIVFEGIDGSGTTTQMNRLAERLKRLSIPVRCDSEPTGSVAGRRLRTLLKTGNAEDPLFNTTMSSLFSLDRALHVYGENGIISTATGGVKLLCDRYFWSTAAYQGVNGDVDEILELNNAFPLPEYLFFLDVDPNEAVKRIDRRNAAKEIYETAAFLEKVRTLYRAALKRYEDSGMKIFTADTSQPADETEAFIASCLDFLPKCR